MRTRPLTSIGVAAVIVSALVLFRPMQVTDRAAVRKTRLRTAAQLQLKTPWGEPDLQGIWTDESDTPLAALPQVCEAGIFHRGAASRVG